MTRALGSPVALHEVADDRGVVGAIGRWRHGSAEFTHDPTGCFQIILNVSGGHTVDHRHPGGVSTGIAAAGAVGFLAPGGNSALRITGDADVVQIFLHPRAVASVAGADWYATGDHHRAIGLAFDASAATALVAMADEHRPTTPVLRRVIGDAARGIAACAPRPTYADSGLPPAARRRAYAVIEHWLQAGEGSPPTVAEMALAAGRSPFHFMRAFRRDEGITPGKAVRARRIDRVVSLLLATDRPLSDIAEATGFCSASHLVAVFGRTLGVTPGALRRAAAYPASGEARGPKSAGI